MSTRIAAAEIYDPSSDAWSSAGSMTEARSSHVATLLEDGRVLIAGGADVRFSVFKVDPSEGPVEVYDPSANAWSETGFMTVARSGHAGAVLADGRVVVSGGKGEFVTIIPSADVYDPSAGVWTEVGEMNGARWEFTATLLDDGNALAAGGKDDAGVVASAEVFDAEADSWGSVGDMAQARMQHTATLLADGKVLVTGGLSAEFKALDTAELYDPAEGAWTLVDARMP